MIQEDKNNNQAVLAETQALLIQWAKWARKIETLGYPNATPFARLRGSTVPEPQINDELAMHVDGLIAKLRNRHPRYADAVMLYAASGGNISYVARTLEVQRFKADSLVNAGLAWLEAKTETYTEVA